MDMLFRWTDGTIVLFAECLEGSCTIARGWRSADRLSDIRRWQFADARKAIGQIRRLVSEATGDAYRADVEAERMAAWLSGRSAPVWTI